MTTQNPGNAGGVAVTVTAGQDLGLEGASCVVVQRQLHVVSAWEELTVEEQER